MKHFISLLFIAVFGHIIAQQELTLDDAVMQQYRKFYPERITGFSWLPNTTKYVYLSTDRGNLYKSSHATKKEEVLLNIKELNELLGTNLWGFYPLEFTDEHSFFMNDGTSFYEVNLKERTGKTLHTLEENARSPLFEPVTKKLAYLINNNVMMRDAKSKILPVTQNNDPNIVSGQAIARSEFGITGGLFWSPKGNYLAFYQKDESKVHDYPLLDINDTPGSLNLTKYPMAGQTSEKARVGIYNTNSLKTVYIETQNDDDGYLTNVSFTPDEKYLFVAEVNRAQNHMWLNVYNTKTGAYIKTVLEETNERWVEPEHPAFFPCPDENSFVWMSEKNGFMNLYYYDFDGKLIDVVTNHDFVVKDIIGTSKDKKHLYYMATGKNPMNTMVYEYHFKKKKSKLLTPVEGTHNVSISDNGTYIYDSYSNGDTPRKALLYTSNGKMAKLLLNAEEKLNNYNIASTELGTLEAKDGTTLHYRLIKPADFDPSKKYPVLNYVYGGPHAQLVTNSWLYGASLWMHWMANQGYLVFTLDNRGSGNRGFAFESQIHRQLGTVEIEDQMTGVSFLKSLPYVDGNRLAVHGWSFGGFMTTSMMLRTPEIYTTGVAGGPVTDWKYYEIMYGERYMDQPKENEEGYEKASLLNKTDQLKGKLLLIHGTSDDVVVMQHNLKLVQKFIESEKQIDFFPYPMHEHNVYGKDRVHLMKKVLNYILDHNK
ncbi:MAG: peptidase S9 [Crocinitomicaceae bacterium TMED16]|nr:MAG: peptidase S9 [Crocinitomicaceae bacterium TMED16]